MKKNFSVFCITKQEIIPYLYYKTEEKEWVIQHLLNEDKKKYHEVYRPTLKKKSFYEYFQEDGVSFTKKINSMDFLLNVKIQC